MRKNISTAVISTLVFFALLPVMTLAASFFYVDDAGNVGIGNSAPLHKLDVSGAIYSRLATATSSTISWGVGNVQSLTLTSSPTLTFVGGQAGGQYTLILKQDGTGGRTVTWPASVLWPSGTTPTLTATANAVDSANFVYDGTNYLGSFTSSYGSALITIARDNHTAFDSSTATTSYKVSYTINGSSNVMLLVGYNGTNGGIGSDNISSITWNGTNLQRDQYQFGGTDNVDAAVYHLAGATSGTHDLVVTLNSADKIQLYAASYTGAEQTSGALATSTKAHNGSSGGSSISLSLNPAVNSWEFGTAVFWNCDFTAATGNHTVLDSAGNGCSRSFDSNGTLSAGSQSFGASYTGSSGASQVGVTFKPAP